MAEETAVPAPRRGLSIDTWAVVIAIAFALLVRFHLIGAIPW